MMSTWTMKRKVPVSTVTIFGGGRTLDINQKNQWKVCICQIANGANHISDDSAMFDDLELAAMPMATVEKDAAHRWLTQELLWAAQAN